MANPENPENEASNGAGGSPEMAANGQTGDQTGASDNKRLRDQDRDKRLYEAVADAIMILRYASQQGLDLEVDRNPIDIEDIVKINTLLEMKKPISDQLESQFWKTYQKLSKRIRPVTIGSIKAITEDNPRQTKPDRTRARSAVCKYRWLSLVSLFVLLNIQFYATFGSNIINGIDLGEKSRREYIIQKKTLEAGLETEQEKTPGDQKKITEIIGQLAGIEEQQEQLGLEIDAKYTLLHLWDLESRIQAVYGWLVALGQSADHVAEARSTAFAQVHDPVPSDAEPAPEAGQSTAPEDGSAGEIQELLGESKPLDGASDLPQPNDPPSKLKDAGGPVSTAALADRHNITDRYIELQRGRIILKSLSAFILPLLYGLLGACAFVLRTLTDEIRQYTFRNQSNIRFSLRLYLGALAGFSVAWFVNSETTPGLAQSITPLALAFLAGYSVELVFAAMDAVIGAFSQDRPQSQPTTR